MLWRLMFSAAVTGCILETAFLSLIKNKLHGVCKYNPTREFGTGFMFFYVFYVGWDGFRHAIVCSFWQAKTDIDQALS